MNDNDMKLDIPTTWEGDLPKVEFGDVTLIWGSESDLLQSNLVLSCHSVITCHSGSTGLGNDERPETTASKELTIQELLFAIRKIQEFTVPGCTIAVHCTNGRTRSAIVVLLFSTRVKKEPFEVALMKMNTEMARVYGITDSEWRVDRQERFIWFVKALGNSDVSDLAGCQKWHLDNCSERASRSTTPNSLDQLEELGEGVRVDVASLKMFKHQSLSCLKNVIFEGVWGCLPNSWGHPRDQYHNASAAVHNGGSILMPAFVDDLKSMTKPKLPSMAITIHSSHFMNFSGKADRLAPESVVHFSMLLGVFQKSTGNVISAGNIYPLTFGPRGKHSFKVYVIMIARQKRQNGKLHPLFPHVTFALCYWVVAPDMTKSGFATRKSTKEAAKATENLCFLPIHSLFSKPHPLSEMLDVGAARHLFNEVEKATTAFMSHPQLHDGMLPQFNTKSSGNRIISKFPAPAAKRPRQMAEETSIDDDEDLMSCDSDSTSMASSGSSLRTLTVASSSASSSSACSSRSSSRSSTRSSRVSKRKQTGRSKANPKSKKSKLQPALQTFDGTKMVPQPFMPIPAPVSASMSIPAWNLAQQQVAQQQQAAQQDAEKKIAKANADTAMLQMRTAAEIAKLKKTIEEIQKEGAWRNFLLVR